MKYFGISTLTDDLGEADDKWAKDFKKKWNPNCSHLKEGHPLDIKIKSTLPDIPLNSLSYFAISFAKKNFLEALDPQIDKYLEFGNIYDASGNLLEEYLTFRARSKKYYIEVRGGPKSTRQFCERCGIFLYGALEKLYILEQDIKESEIFQSSWPDLVISKNVFKRLKEWTSNKSSQLDIIKLPVLKEPRDGLPIDFSNLKPGDIEEWGFGEKTKGIW